MTGCSGTAPPGAAWRRSAAGEQEEYTRAFQLYTMVAGRFRGTRAAERAEEAAASLRDANMVGYDASCRACREAKQACARHGRR